MSFPEQKRRSLAALAGGTDRSKKGTVDEAIVPLLNAINAFEEYYTTSSCAGRIDLFVEPESGKKHDGSWLLVSHERVSEDVVASHLGAMPQETVWFRMEGAILHVACRSLEAAENFLRSCRDAGWKHSGITGTKRFLVEATTPERIDVPIAQNGELFVSDKFIRFLVKEANTKLARTREKVARLLKLYQ